LGAFLFYGADLMKVSDKTYKKLCKTCVWANKVDAKHVYCSYSPTKCVKEENKS